MKQRTILILGANGLVGNTVYNYFRKNVEFNTIGTSRKKDLFEIFQVNTLNKDLSKILDKYKKIDTVINCIGDTQKDSPIKNLIEINALFPQLLSDFLARRKTKLIHISSDAVYSITERNATELTTPSPETAYGASKFLGEPRSKFSISIRTSILDISKNRNNGLLDRARKNTQPIVEGYTNQIWSGCTAIQLANFMKELILNWDNTKKYNGVINFAPIGPISRYEILQSAHLAGIINKKIVKKKISPEVTRSLSSIYLNKKYMSKYSDNIALALLDMVSSHCE